MYFGIMNQTLLNMKLPLFAACLGFLFTVQAQTKIQDNLYYLNKTEEPTDSFYVFKFFATWCVPCIGEMPEYNQMVEAHKDKPIRFVTVSAEKDAAKVEQVLARYKAAGSWALDTNRVLFKEYAVEWIPHYVLINSAGELGFSGERVALESFLETGEMPKNTEDPFFEAIEKPSGTVYKFKTGEKTDKPYGSCTVSVGDEGAELEFKDYSVLTFIGAQANDFTLMTILSDTNDFKIDLKVNDTVKTQEAATKRAEQFLRNELHYRLDTVILFKEVWELVEMKEVELLQSYSGGSFFGSDSIRFKYS